MTALMQAVAGVLVAVVIVSVLQKQGRESALLLSLAVCAMVLGVAAGYLHSAVEMVRTLQETAGLDDELVETALKAVGIALLTQFAALICTDSGNGAMGRTLELLGTAAILWLSMPLMTALLELIRTITGEL